MKGTCMKNLSLVFLAVSTVLSHSVIASAHEHARWGNSSWMGNIILPNKQKIPMGFELYSTNGIQTANLVSPAQGSFVNPVSDIRIEGSTLSFKLPTIGAEINLKQSGKCAKGVLNQGIDLTLEVCRTSNLPTLVKDQDPQIVAYATEDFVIPGAKDGVFLSGTLTSPNKVQNSPIVVLVAGSGPSDRDGDVNGHKPYWVLADQLTRQGFTVFRFDKRGVKKSTGSFTEATLTDLTDDVVQIVRDMQQRFKGRKVGVIGHSEGGSIAADAAVQAKADFIVSLAGIGLSGLDSMLLQDGTEAAAKGASEAEVKDLRRIARGYYAAILRGTNPQSQADNAAKYVSELSAEDKATYDKWSKGAYTLELKNAGETGWVSLLKTDPTPVWGAVTIPLLAINGDKDIQVPHESHLEGIKASAKSSPKAEFLVLSNVNHMMQTASDGNPKLYGENSVTVDPDIAILIKDWFSRAVKAIEL